MENGINTEDEDDDEYDEEYCVISYSYSSSKSEFLR